MNNPMKWEDYFSVAYELVFPVHVRAHNVFHGYLLNKYVCDTKHVFDWSLLQVEPEREFSPEPTDILDKRQVHSLRITMIIRIPPR